ncbi:MAG TPA: PQQ-binding-like beta-propeller repeat protein [Aggregatilineales bacterium]|nr:PQQ-binding-like beta-propeller repeat protein [Aggregatilineales bacterium]
MDLLRIASRSASRVLIARLSVVALILLLATGVTASPVAQSANVDWPQFQFDAQHTGRTSAFVTPRYRLKWAWFDPAHITRNFTSAPNRSITDGFGAGFATTNVFAEQMQPIVAEGKVYVGTMNNKFYAIDSLTGDSRWEFTAGGPILHTAAYNSSIVVFGSMDGNIYALNASNGSLRWKYQTGAGVNAAPIIARGLVLVGSRDGRFYALDLSAGTLRWNYSTRVHPANPASPFNQSPITTPAAVSEDGSIVMFGAENMFFYGLLTDTGAEQWAPKKLIGQSFHNGWPVVANGRVVVRTQSSLEGAEFLMEPQLDSLPPNPAWAQEESVILNWLAQNPNQKTMYVFDVVSGQEPFQVAMGRVTGNNHTPHPPVLDYMGRMLTYWRSRTATFTSTGACFGTKYCPDISGLNLTNGDRIPLTPGTNGQFAPELDNGFMLSSGGQYLYALNTFRGSFSIHLPTGSVTRIATALAKHDCADYRAWGFNIIFYGNDSSTDTCALGSSMLPSEPFQTTSAFSGIAIATTNGTTLLYSTEAMYGFIAAYEHVN